MRESRGTARMEWRPGRSDPVLEQILARRGVCKRPSRPSRLAPLVRRRGNGQAGPMLESCHSIGSQVYAGKPSIAMDACFEERDFCSACQDIQEMAESRESRSAASGSQGIPQKVSRLV